MSHQYIENSRKEINDALYFHHKGLTGDVLDIAKNYAETLPTSPYMNRIRKVIMEANDRDTAINRMILAHRYLKTLNNVV